MASPQRTGEKCVRRAAAADSLRAALVSIKVDVEAGGVAKAGAFADVGDPRGAGAEGGGVGALGHEEDVGGGPAFYLLKDGVDLGEVGFVCDDELQLEVGGGVDEALDGVASRLAQTQCRGEPIHALPAIVRHVVGKDSERNNDDGQASHEHQSNTGVLKRG